MAGPAGSPAGGELDRGAEGGADLTESSVEAAGQGVHAGNCAEGDEGDDEGVFHEVLAFFTARQILELGVHLDKQSVHLNLPRFDFPGL